MDIYFGSSTSISLQHSSEFLNFNSLGDYKRHIPSEYLNVLRQVNGESLITNDGLLEIIFDGYITGLQGPELKARILELAKKVVNQTKIDQIDYNGIFNICIREQHSGNIWLTSDPFAALPLYYSQNNGSFFYCSHGHMLGSILDAKPDFGGIMQKVALGYTLGQRYYYDGINRINPGETIRYNSATKEITSSNSPVYYTGYEQIKDEEEVIFNSLCESFKNMRKDYEEIGLMLSEGFDSRFLGGMATKQGFRIKSYTHGTSGTKGQVIVEKVADSLNSEHHFQSMLDGYNHDREHLVEQLYLSDNLNYPFWLLGSEHFKRLNFESPVIIGSSLDCTLGGNLFYRPTKPVSRAVFQRYAEIIKQQTGMLTNKYIENLSSQLLVALLKRNTREYSNLAADIFNADLSQLITKELKYLNDHIETELKRITVSGSELPSLQLQRFTLENRDRKLFFGQPLTIRKHNRIYIPSFEFGFLNKAATIHPAHKFHHKLYINILKKFLPDQLKITNGTYGIQPRYPRAVLETSRFINKGNERKMYRDLLESKGKIDLSGFRSASIFELCGRSEADHKGFEQHIMNNKDLFNTTEMRSYIKQARDYKIRVFNYERIFRGLEICQVINKHI